MTGMTPRDTREWMRTIERGLLNARGAAASIAGAVVEKRLDDYATEVNNDRNRIPAPPIELTTQTYITLGPDKRFHAGVIVDFPDVTIGTDALPMTISQYELWGRTGTDNYGLLTTAGVSALQWFGAEPGSWWDFKVRAIGELSVKPGAFSAVVTVQMLNDTTAPGQPSAPVATAYGRTIKVEWDGKVAGGADMPLDLEYVIVAAGTDPSPTTEAGRIEPGGPGLFIDTLVPYNTPKFYRLRAVDTSGNLSPWSAQATASGHPLVDDDIILAAIDAAETIITNLGAESIKSGAILTGHLADNSISQAKLQDQIVSLAKMDTAANTKIQKGIDDAATAFTAAGTADGKAVTAQSAADAARAVADAQLAAGVTLTLNGNFDAPITSPPLGWPSRTLAVVQASATTARSGTNVLKCSPSTASSAYAYTDLVASAKDRVFYVEYWVRPDQAIIAANNALKVGVFFDQRDVAGAASNSPQYGVNGTLYPEVPLSSLTPGTWTKFAVTYKVSQASNAQIRFGPRIPSLVTAGNTFEVDGFRAIDITEAQAALDAAAAAQTKADQAFSDAYDANVAAGLAQSSANGKNNIYYLAALPGGSGFADGDTVFIRAGVGSPITAQYKWVKTGPSAGSWNAETLSHQVIASVDLGKATVGELDGVYVKANTLRAKSLLVSDLVNFAPSLGESPDDWTLSGGMSVVTTALDPAGFRFNATENTSTAWARGPFMAVTPGESLYATATSYRAGGGTNGMFLRYEWYDKDKAPLASPVYTGSAQASTSPGGTKFELVATVPAGAAYTRFTLPIVAAGAGSGISSGYYNFAGRRQTGSVYIADGAVTADKVLANSIGAKQILVGDFANIAIGSDFEDDTAIPWALAAAHTTTTAQKKAGAKSLRLAANAAVQTSTFLGDLRVKEGEQYYFKYHAYIDASFNGTAGNSKLRIGNQSGTFIADKAFTTITRSAWTTVPLEVIVTVPAGVTSLQVTLNSDHTAGTAYIDDIQIRRMSEASLIQNLGVEKLVVGTGQLDTAVIDNLWTNVVRAKSITTDMLNVGRGDNMISWNVKSVPSALAPHTTVNGAVINYMTDSVHSGKTSLYLTGAAVTSGVMTQVIQLKSGYTADNGSVNHWNVKQNDKMVIEGWFRAGGTYTNGNPNVRFQVNFQTASGAYHSTLTSANLGINFSWQNLSFEFQTPSAAASMYIYIQQDQPGGLRIDDPFMAPQYQASLVSQGAILTRHLTVTEDMTVALLSAHKVLANEIDTNDLAADVGFVGDMTAVILTVDSVKAAQIDATGGITSKHTITGATIQTLTTANRGIKLTGGNFTVYDASGTGAKTFEVTGSTGAVVGTGRWRTGTSGNYIEMYADTDGGRMKFWTGTGTGRGQIYARDDAGGKRMTLTYSDLDAPAYTVPLLALKDREVSLDYGSKHIRLGDNGSGSEQLLLDATGTDVLIKGGLELSDSSARIRWRYSSSNFTLGYLGQRPETNSGIADFELRAAANGVRISGTELIANPIYNNTSSSAANVFVDSAGKVWRSTSASKYKADQRLLTVPDALLGIPMKDWVDKNQLALHEEMAPLAPFADETEQARFDAINLTREPGVIAEDVVAAGGEQFTIFGPDGQVEGVKYERLALAQIQVLYRRLLEAEQKITELQGA